MVARYVPMFGAALLITWPIDNTRSILHYSFCMSKFGCPSLLPLNTTSSISYSQSFRTFLVQGFLDKFSDNTMVEHYIIQFVLKLIINYSICTLSHALFWFPTTCITKKCKNHHYKWVVFLSTIAYVRGKIQLSLFCMESISNMCWYFKYKYMSFTNINEL